MYAEHVYDSSLPTPSQMRWVAGATNPDAVPLPAVSPSPVRSLRSVDMPANLTVTEFQQLDSIVLTTRHVRCGEKLFRARDVFLSLYTVRTGSFKTVVLHRDGHEQVTGFQIPGDSLGLGGICAGTHNCDAIALEDSTVCVMPFSQLESLCSRSHRMQRYLHQLMSGEIVRESSLMMLLGTMTAEQRLAFFLLDLAARFRARGYSGTHFNLKMSREEIGCLLGMKLETVSRMFSRFHKEGMVEPNGKEIRIVDAERLSRV